MTTRRTAGLVALALAGGLAIGAAGSAIASDPTPTPTPWSQMMGGGGMVGGSGMMGGRGMTGDPGDWNHMMGGASDWSGMMGAWSSPADPGTAGFTPGTVASPRIVRILATPHLRFVPDLIRVEAGETVTFEVTSMGMPSHEFMVGPAEAVETDQEGTPEVADIGMMETKSLTYTFSGPGPFAYACHAPGHYEAGMAGTIVIVP
jgi:plastocyanin